MKSEQLRVDFLLFAFAVNTMGKRIYSNSPKFSPKSLNVHRKLHTLLKCA